MPWVIGIDEAGYGPNLGPLVQAAAVIWAEPDDLSAWLTYRKWVRRCHETIDERFLIDDSKKVYQGRNKLSKLERTVLLFLGFQFPAPKYSHSLTFQGMLSPGLLTIEDQHPGITGEYCFDGSMPIPLEWKSENNEDLFTNFMQWVVVAGPYGILPRIVATSAFNEVVKKSNNKADVLSEGLIALLRESYRAGRVGVMYRAESPILVYCDKQGGRHYYAPLLQEAFPQGWVVAERESPAESRYRIENLDREVTVIFRPRADADSVSVALASMTAKYLREVCMKQFNAFWAKHVPGLQPTAGYPGDAKRFYREIEPAMKKLGIAKDAVWRMK